MHAQIKVKLADFINPLKLLVKSELQTQSCVTITKTSIVFQSKVPHSELESLHFLPGFKFHTKNKKNSSVTFKTNKYILEAEEYEHEFSVRVNGVK